MDFDNSGFLVGEGNREVRHVLVTLDITEDVITQAQTIGADLIVSHHPLIFHKLSSVRADDLTGSKIIRLIRSGISAICMHTNLDAADGGVNDTLAQVLELKNITVIGSENLLRSGSFSDTLPAFIEHVKARLGCKGLRYVDGGKPVNRVAVGGGSCGSALAEVADAGCDTFVTADVKYNQFWDAKEMGINLIDAGHFHTENPVCAVLADKLQKAFPEVQVILSKKHADCVNFY
jgi:dinuclear metal center YbgI/SA1388 family protein